ncbi:MAG: iron ABC transporter permease [Acidobacteriota bacterium]|nr:iron ABC transporter permease [Acidobacteriota bacterium]
MLLLAVVVSAGLGAVRFSLAEVVRAILHPSATDDASVVLFTLRLPRVLAAGLAGAGLAATGVLFQGLFRNPLADPFVLGSSGGAAFGGAIAIFMIPGFSFGGVGAVESMAFLGSLASMGIVWALARPGKRFAMEDMLLAGFAIGTILNAATAALEMRDETTNPAVRILTAWLHGEITVPSWTQLLVVSVTETMVILLALPLARQLNAVALSEEYAAQLGVRVARLQVLVIMAGSLLTALAVSLGGLIGFVGLLVPHFLRLLFGPDHFRLLPAAAFSGAAFLIVADTIARTAFAPREIPVGMLTAFLGGPAFLYLLHRTKRRA